MNPISILVVEDEGIVAENLTRKLEQLGYAVAGTAENGSEAVEMALHLRPQLVLMDIQLQGRIDGIQAAQQIKDEYDVPVIYLTAHSDPATLTRAKLTRPFGYILKPFEIRDLATQIELALYKHQADRQLREQREWLRVTLTSIGEAVLATDDRGRISFLNPVAEALTGWTAPEAMGRPVEEVFRIINEQTGQPVEVPVDLVLRERRTVPLANHTAIITKDGRSVPVEDSAAPIMDATGNVIGVVLVFHDVTEKRRAAEALQASEERLRESQSKLESALNSITDAVFITDAEGRFIDSNDAFATYHKFRNKEECSKSFAECPDILDVWMADGQPAPPQMWAVPRALRGERVTHTEYTLRRKDTGETWVGSYSFGPIRNKDGEITGSVVVGRDITERKKMEDAVHKSEQLLRDVLNNMVAMIGLMTPDGTLILANRTSLEAANLTPEEVLGKPFEECYWWAWSSVVQERLRNAIARAAAGQVSRYDEVIRVGEGEYRTIDFMLSPMFGTDGRITYLIPSATDISDRKKAEEALHLAVERYERQVRLFQGITDTTPDFVYLFDLQGRFQYANRRLLEVWGMTLEQVIGKTCRELGYEQWHHDMHMREIAQVIETKRPIKGEVPFKAPLTGIFGVYEYIFTPVISPDGEVELIAGTTRDISERKHMEDKLKESEKQLTAILEQLPVGVGLIDDNGSYILSNSAMKANVPGEGAPSRDPTRIKQWKTFDADGKLVPPNNWPGARALRGEFVNGMEFIFTTEDGDELWKLIYAAPFRSHRNEAVGAVVVAQDITARKYAERKLHELTANLEKQVSERTAMAENRSKQLQSLAIELIETEERERRKFAHLLHDDLQQMLASARFQLHSVSGDKSTEPVLENVGRILEESIAKARRLTHELSPPVMHHGSLFSAMEWLSGQMNEHFGLNVYLEGENMPELKNSPVKVFVFRAVQELLFNIVKHSGVKNANVLLSGKDSHLDVTVSDQGKGFDKEDLDRSKTKKGFGLISIHERARYVGGDLIIKSEPGRGSSFYLTVPVQPAIVESVRMPTEAPPFHAVAPKNSPGTGGLRVLFADDHKVMRQGLIRLISSQPDIQVAGEAANGKEAVELARQLRPDVIVMDISMPEMDGIEATRRIKAEMPEVRVIGLSMFEDKNSAQNIINAGAHCFVPKTASSAELLKAIYGSCD
jgi:PAS domain S-box-containing protein